MSPALQRERSNSKSHLIGNLTDQSFTPFSGSLLNLAPSSCTPILHHLMQPVSQPFAPSPLPSFLSPILPP